MGVTDVLKRKILIGYELMSIPSYKTDFNLDKDILQEIAQHHQYYVQNISSPEMALSLELAQYIYNYCCKHQPKKVVDFGSGFSSYVLRLYQQNHSDIEVYSVDDNEEWLEKTKSYLSQRDVSLSNIYSLKEFMELNQSSFGFILLDLNFVELRKNYLSYSIEQLSDDGTLIIDDTHKVEYLREVKRITAEHTGDLLSIKNNTIDTFGRFSLLYKK